MGWAILSVYIGQRLIGVNLHTGPNQVPVPPIKVRELAWLLSSIAFWLSDPLPCLQLYAPVFLLCVIVGYVIKDRMKEFGKRWVLQQKVLPRSMPDSG